MKQWKIIKKNDEYLNPTVLIRKDNSLLLTESNLMLVKGESGSGKSRIAMNFMVGFSGSAEELGFIYTTCPSDKHVLYLSTEMSDHDLQRRLVKVLEQCPTEYEDRLIFANIEGCDDKFEGLKDIVEEYPPYVIIIDQVGDFVTNVNDLEACSPFLSSFLSYTREIKCGVVVILHQNEDGGIGKKARGHLGSILEQKVVSSLAIADNKKGFVMRTTKMRTGGHLYLHAEFNENTEMLKVVGLPEKIDKFAKILEQLTLPNSKGLVCEQIGEIQNLKQYNSQHEILKELIKRGFLEETLVGRNRMIDTVKTV